MKTLFQNVYDNMSAGVTFIIEGDAICKKFLATDSAGHYVISKNAQNENVFNTTQLVQTLPEEQLIDMKPANDNAYVRMAMERYEVGCGVSYQVASDNTVSVQKITFQYTFTWHDGTGALTAKNAVINHARNFLQSSAYPSTSSDYIKLKAINNYICSTFQYDYRLFVQADASQTIYTAYGMITDSGAIGGYQRGVCQAYAMYGYIMLKLAGFEAITVDGNAGGGGHAWNMVKTQSQWYHIDFTWDDPVSEGNPPPYTLRQSGKGFVEETYLLRTDSEISVNHSWLQIQNDYRYPLTPTGKYPDTAPMPANVPTQRNPAPTVTLIPSTITPANIPTSAISVKSSASSADSSSKAETDSAVGSIQTATLNINPDSASSSPGQQPTTSTAEPNTQQVGIGWINGLIIIALLLAIIIMITSRRKKKWE